MSKRKAKTVPNSTCGGTEDGCECGQAGAASDADEATPRAAKRLSLCSPGTSKMCDSKKKSVTFAADCFCVSGSYG